MTRARELSRLLRSNAIDETSELVLVSADPDDPQANVFVRFRDYDGNTKGVMGFTASGDDTMSMTSYRNARMKFRTGNAAETAFLDRMHAFGDDNQSYIAIVSPRSDNIGGCYVRFTRQDPTVPKGYIGFASTTDDDIDVLNSVSGGHVDVQTTGAGVIKLRPGGTEGLRVEADGVSLIDGVTAPIAVSGRAKLFVDSADGDLKIIFADGTTKTIVVDT